MIYDVTEWLTVWVYKLLSCWKHHFSSSPSVNAILRQSIDTKGSSTPGSHATCSDAMLSGHLQVSFTADRPYLASKVCTGFGSRMVDYSLHASGVLQEVLNAVLWLSFRKL